MAKQSITIREADFGNGIDKQSAENRIPEGFCEDIENADPQAAGHIIKRRGYQGYAGNLPVRVKSITYRTGGTDNLQFTLDSSIKMPTGASQPLVVYGKTSSSNTLNEGDFPNDTNSANYYSEFLADVRKPILTGLNNINILEAEHGLTNKYIFVGSAQSLSPVKDDNTQFYPEAITIDGTTREVTITNNNLSGSDYDGFFFLEERPVSTGQTYHSLLNNIPDGGTTQVTITAGTHALDGRNIIVKAFINNAGDLTEVQPEQVMLNDTTGDVTVSILNESGAAFDVDIILSLANAANFLAGAVAPASSTTVELPGTTPFAFVACYLETPPSPELYQVIPDSIVYDSDLNVIRVTFTNNNATGANFEIYWDYATISTNFFKVTASTVTTQFTDNAPQLTIWGLDHSELYGTREARAGWANHIDSYRSAGENRLISGLGGNLFAARLRSEGLNSTEYLMPALYPSLSGRLDSDIIIGPAFYDTGETPNRTRGYITGDNGANNFLTISSVAYNSGTGYMDYTFTVPGLAIFGTLTDIISSTTGLEDYLTAQQCGYSVHNGSFKVKGITNPAANTLIISVENANITSSDYDETDVGGEGGVFTDRLTFTADSPFLNGDVITSDLFSSADLFSVINTISGTTLIDNVIDLISLPGGLRVVGQRNSYIVPLRDINRTATVENVVRGDMLNYSEINRQLRVVSVNPNDDISLTITGDGDNATAVLGSGTTISLFAGKKVLILGSPSYNGVHTILEIIDDTSFLFASESETNESAVLAGYTIEVDEELSFQDTTQSTITVDVDSRWIPIEIPEDSYDATPKTIISHFNSNGYTDQALIRSTMVNDTLYLTNNDDEVLKFDGANIYRAGLFRWQPNMFFTIDTTSTGKIDIDIPTVSLNANATNNRFQVAEADQDAFEIGTQIVDSTDNISYLVTGTKAVSPNAYIYVNKTISGGTSGQTLTKVNAFKYYFRLNAVDANNNVIASAVTGSEDSVVNLTADAAINIRLVGMPVWDIYDYVRLEVQIDRTRAGSPAPFYKLTTLPMEFDNNTAYIDYIDTDSDDDLLEFDEVNTALKGAEIGTAWTGPLRAKYCTSADNRLVLGNVTDFPTLDLQFLKRKATITQSVLTNNSNKRWLFKVDNTDIGTVTDMINRAAYEFRATSSALTISGITLPTSSTFRIAAAVPHGLAVGDWVYLFRDSVTDAQNLTFAGWYQVRTVESANNVIFNNPNNPTSVPGVQVNRMLIASVPQDIPVPIGTDGNFSNLTGNKGTTVPYEFIAMKRLAMAINASMRNTDLGISGYETFTPWMIANAGGEFNSGQLIITQPKILETNLELVIPVLTNDFDVFVNSIKRSGSAQAGSITRVYPSRILVSYPNYPEIFDSPTAVVDTQSDSAIDVNSADGQEITAIIPFFGDSAFGSAQKSGIVVVFKTNSIYLVDLNAKSSGLQAVQRLESMGKGCTAPNSVAVTRDGIMFANDTGIYKLTRSLTIEFVGRRYERKFNQTVNRDQLSIVTGHHDTYANAYKLSYPLLTETENSHVAVYNHTREYEQAGKGSWTTYTNHPVTGWANLIADSYFASTTGRVFIIRRLGEVSDFRDDNQAISMEIITRALDAGDSSRRKIFSNITTQFRVPAESVGTSLLTSTDLNSVFLTTDAFDIKTNNGDGIGQDGFSRVVSISSSVQNKRGVYMQLKYLNSTIDEPVELVGIDYTVTGLGIQGVLQAKDTKD